MRLDRSAAVEAGARAWFDHLQSQRRDDGRFRDAERTELWRWDDLPAIDKHAYREFVLPIVTAAIEALEEQP